MKTNRQHIKTSLTILFFLPVLFGCASLFLGTRFYSGKVLPRADVAFLYLTGDCQLGSLTKEGQEKMKFLMWSEARGEILPGDYLLELRYFNQGVYNNRTKSSGITTEGDIIELPLNAKAGHVYYIMPEISSGVWRPVVIDVANEKDYAKITDRNPKNVQKKIKLYFQGKRKPVQESEFHTRDGGVINRWH